LTQGKLKKSTYSNKIIDRLDSKALPQGSQERSLIFKQTNKE